jgi:putative membrane protein
MNWQIISNSILFALLGVFLFVAMFLIIDKITPYHLWRELVEKQNTALAIVVGSFALGICIIVAAAIH